MSESLSDAELSALERAEKTAGPSPLGSREDQTYVIALRNAAPRLLAEIRRLREENAKLRIIERVSNSVRMD